MKSKKSIIIYIVLVIGTLVLINLLANRFFFRLDFTENKQYTLSQATRDLLKELNEPITVTAYFSEGLPPNIMKSRQDFKDLLTEYASRSDGNVVYEFINPNKDEQTEQEAMQNGISPVVINVREKNQAVQKKAYLGAVLKYSGNSEVIPFIQPGGAVEYTLSSAIKKLVAIEKPLIGFIQGHGEPTTSMFSQVMAELNVLYQVEGVNITDSTYLPKYKTLVLDGPTDSIPEWQLNMLDDYLANGGNMVIAMNRVEGDLSQARGFEVTTGLETWLEKKGFTVEGNFVIDDNCGTVGVRQQQGAFSFTTQLQFPYLPVISTFADHPVTKGIEQVIFQFASPITFSGDSTLNFQPLIFSSQKSGTQMAPLYFNINKEWGDSDFRLSGITLGALLEGKISGELNSRIIVFSDGDFAVNGPGNSGHQLQPDNVNLFVNSIDWMSDDTGLIELRTKGVTSRPLKQIEDGKKTFLKWFNFLLPVILIILYGVFRMERNRRRRDRRRDENYNR
ncbi:MAG: Gldg family protein [Prolixibacteraceae bacterium]|nr:Gldg family protein [Prolixibacteraceae bacterium]MBN2774667.1 Gldg family protein [Prolixibacteraceae bacterium]